MGFLGSAASFAKRFLGQAGKAVQFIGKNLHHVSSGLTSFKNFVAHPTVQKIGSEVGIPPSIFTTAGRVADTLNNGVNLLPTLASNTAAAGRAAMAAYPSSTRQSLADLYSEANNV
jgi:hypothetical protein